MRTLLRLIPLSLAVAPFALGQNPLQTPTPDAALVRRALANELAAAQNTEHPMRFRLRKWSPRLTTTKEMVETRDGTIAMLVAVNDRPLDRAQQQKEETRLRDLFANPGKQRHRQQAQVQDTARALKVLRALPAAFIYQYAGQVLHGASTLVRFDFKPNPAFNPPDLETQALTALAGEIWIDPVGLRVVRLDGRLRDDVDFGWGILGRLYRGGWISIEQADVGAGVWRIVRFQMKMSARVVIRTRTFETTEDESDFAPVPFGLNYRQGIELLQARGQSTAHR
ncbi:MAG: hypothetical protein ACLGSD_06535 [Acidobacteriota bacterium]